MVVEATGVEAVVVVVAEGGGVVPPDPLEDDVEDEAVTVPADADAVAEGPLELPELGALLTVTVEEALATLVVTVVLDGEVETFAETGTVGSPPACAGSANVIHARPAAALTKRARARRDNQDTLSVGVAVLVPGRRQAKPIAGFKMR